MLLWWFDIIYFGNSRLEMELFSTKTKEGHRLSHESYLNTRFASLPDECFDREILKIYFHLKFIPIICESSEMTQKSSLLSFKSTLPSSCNCSSIQLRGNETKKVRNEDKNLMKRSLTYLKAEKKEDARECRRSKNRKRIQSSDFFLFEGIEDIFHNGIGFSRCASMWQTFHLFLFSFASDLPSPKL